MIVILKSMSDFSNWVIWVWFCWLFYLSITGCSFLCISKSFDYMPDICCGKTTGTQKLVFAPRKGPASFVGALVWWLSQPTYKLSGVLIMFLLSFSAVTTDFRFLYQWTAVILCFVWGPQWLRVVSVSLFHTQLSALPVWSIFLTSQ